MIYVCIAANNDAATIGLLLWKIRQVFQSFPREYQLLVADDGSTDATADVLSRYQRALPLTVLRQERPRGPAACTEALLREGLRRSDRPRRDVALVIPPDFTVSPDGLPELLRRIDSGADLVVGETPAAALPFGARLVRHLTPWLLPAAARVPGVRDVLSGCAAIRLVTVRGVLQEGVTPFSTTHPLAWRAELVAWAAGGARQVATAPLLWAPGAVPFARVRTVPLAVALKRAGRHLPAPRVAPSPPARSERAAPAQRSAS